MEINTGNANNYTTNNYNIDINKQIELSTKYDNINIKNAEEEYSKISDKLDYYLSFESKISNFYDVVKTINSSDNIFNYRNVLINSSTDLNNNLGVKVDNGAKIGQYKVNIQQIATSTQYQTSDDIKINSLDHSLVKDEFNLKIKFSDKEHNISFEKNSDLNRIVSKINSYSNDYGIKADIVKKADNDYKLVISSKNTGEINDFTLSFSNSEIASKLGIDEKNKLIAQDSIIDVNGVKNIKRSTNEINDIIKGVEFSLYNTSNGKDINVDIVTNNDSISETLNQLVESYNELLQSYSLGIDRDDNGKFYNDSYFSKDVNIRYIINNIYDVMNQTINNNFNNINDIGLSFNSKELYIKDVNRNVNIVNYLNLDQNKLLEKLNNNSDLVSSILVNKMTSYDNKTTIISNNSTKLQGDIDLSLDLKQMNKGESPYVLLNDNNGYYFSNKLISDFNKTNDFYINIIDDSGNNKKLDFNNFNNINDLIKEINKNDKLSADIINDRLAIKSVNATIDFKNSYLGGLEFTDNKKSILNVAYNYYSEKSISSNINSDYSFQEGDKLSLDIIDINGNKNRLTFNYSQEILEDNHFNNIDSFIDAINKTAYINAEFHNNKIHINSYDPTITLAFDNNSNLQKIMNFNNTAIVGGSINFGSYYSINSAVSNNISEGISGVYNINDKFTDIKEGQKIQIIVNNKYNKNVIDLIYSSNDNNKINSFNNISSLVSQINNKYGLSATIDQDQIIIRSNNPDINIEFKSDDIDIQNMFGWNNINSSTKIDNDEYTGYKLLYNGNGTEDSLLKMNFTNGISNKLDDLLSNIQNNIMKNVIEDIKLKQSDSYDNVQDLTNDLSEKKESLLNKYSNFQSKIMQSNNRMNYIEALFKAQEDN